MATERPGFLYHQLLEGAGNSGQSNMRSAQSEYNLGYEAAIRKAVP